MKKLKEQFQKRLSMFALFMLAFLLVSVTVSCYGMDSETLLSSVSVAGFSASLPIWFVVKDNITSFKSLSDEEVSKLTDEEKGKYLADMIKDNSTQLEAMKADMLKNNTIELEKKFNTLLESQLNVLKSASEAQGVVLAKLQKELESKGTDGLDGKKTELITFIERDRTEILTKKANGMELIMLKTAALMTTANVVPNVASGFNQLFGNYIDSEIYKVPKPENFILGLVDTQIAPGTENIWYVQRINLEGDAAFIAEGALKPLADGEYKEFKADIKEVAVRWKMSNRLIMHAPSVVADFRTHATELVEQKIDTDILTGDGTSDTVNGVTNLASPFVVPTELAGAYATPNIFDAIMAVASYVRLNNFKGNLTAVLNTVWMAKFLSYKEATTGQYILPSFVTQDGKRVGEVTIRFENKMPADKILLGDLKQFKVRISEDTKYYEGWENDDFSKNLSSRKIESFLGTYFPSNLAGSIIYDDIDTVLTAIATT